MPESRSTLEEYRRRVLPSVAFGCAAGTTVFWATRVLEGLQTGDFGSALRWGGVTSALFLAWVLSWHVDRTRVATALLLWTGAAGTTLCVLFDPAVLAALLLPLGCAILVVSTQSLWSESRLWSFAVAGGYTAIGLIRAAIDPLPIATEPNDIIAYTVGGALGVMVIGETARIGNRVLADALETAERSAHKLQRANIELEGLSRQAMDASAAKSAFLTRMSHELRTPLNAIIGYADLIAEEVENDFEFTDDLERIRRAGTHLRDIIGDILDLSKIEAGELTSDPTLLDLEDVVESMRNQLAFDVETNGNQLVLEVVGASACADKNMVHAILVNLVQNAARHTRNGEIRVRVAAETGELVVSVDDTGSGIAPENLSRIFDAFAQSDESSTRLHDGLGLGLTLVRSYTEMMGGRVSVESTLGVGSHFEVRVPVVMVSEMLGRRHARQSSDTVVLFDGSFG